MAEAKSLQCGIVGAGIAGLAAAIALRRAGHEVEIYEKSHFKNEIGAAITFTPNANRILEHWSLDSHKAKETDKCQWRRLDAQTLERIAHTDFSDVEAKFGHRFCAYHRVDIHNLMRETAVSEALPGRPVSIHLGSQVMDINCEEGIMTLYDGTRIAKDLLIIADGIKSRFLEAIVGMPVPTKKTGKSVYRTLIPINRLMKDDLVRPILQDEPSGFCSVLSKQTGVMLVTYPCRSDEIMNVALFHTTRADQRDKDDWNSPASVEDMLDQLKVGFHPAWSALFKQADSANCYTVNHRDPVPRMVRGKVALIGDAAHPMQPTHAQGGAMGIEDAGALEVLFSNFGANDSVERRLELLNQLRIPRNTVTALYSNAMFYNESSAQIESRIREHYQGRLLPPQTDGWSVPIQDFFFPYDVFAEAKKAMQYEAQGKIPEGVITNFGEVAA